MGKIRFGSMVLTLLLVVAACGRTSEEVSAASSTIAVDSTVEEGTLGSPDDTRNSTDLTAVPGAVSGTSAAPEEPDPGAPLPTLPDPKVPRDLEPLVAQARADLAATLGSPETDITVAVAEYIVWPDSSLGCPQIGIEYTQRQVEGWRVVFTHGGATYSYHGGGTQPEAFLCRYPSFPAG